MDEIDQSLAALRDPDAAVRKAAAETLGKAGDQRAVSVLIQALKDKHAPAAAAAARALGAIGCSQAAGALIQACIYPGLRSASIEGLILLGESAADALTEELSKGAHYLTTSACVDALCGIGSPAVPALIEALDRSDVSDVSFHFIHILGQTGDMRAVPALVRCLGRSREIVNATAEALGTLGDCQVVPALICAFEDGDEATKPAIARALTTLGDTSAISALSYSLRDPGESIRARAAAILAKSNQPDAISALVTAMASPNAGTRNSATTALTAIGDAAVPALLDAFEHANDIAKPSIAAALATIGDPRPVVALSMALQDPSESVRALSAYALSKSRTPQALEALTGSLRDQSAGVAQIVISELVRIGKTAVPYVIELFRDGNEEVRRRAVATVVGIGAASVEPVAHVLGQGRMYLVETECAAAALEQIGAAGVPYFQEALGSSNFFLRRRAARALGAIGDKRSVPDLVDATKDADADVRRLAVAALGKVADSRSVSAIIFCLSTTSDPEMRTAAALSLMEIARNDPIPELRSAVAELSRWQRHGAGTVFRDAITAIIQATDAVKSLPVASSARAAQPGELPLPASRVDGQSDSLPIASLKDCRDRKY